MATYKIKLDNNRKFYWILKSDKNHETVAMSSESYDTREGARKSISWVKANAENASIDDDTL
jgi:uncharacterized protein YegP (UPF0339 family)